MNSCSDCGANLDGLAEINPQFCPACGKRIAKLPVSREEKLFSAAQDVDADRRDSFLDEACGTDAELRARIEALIAADAETDSLLDMPATEAAQSSTDDRSDSQEIGPYKLLQKIGEGGMGSVFMAEQEKPVKRLVALKVVKAGLDSKQVVARFEAERQTLAMMDHPNIARVLDAGSTDRGEPYFVMELVKGVPIHEYCDTNRLSTKDRIKLMVDVCGAVQHAHQKGIIHRDLKPSNILVAQYDDRPVPKVIDFGVAKATHQKLTEKTLYTQLGQIVGTLEYMSPEQAVLNQLDVDTRTDVYSLGVILYELLVGETPLDSKELRSKGLDQILRTIREEEPPRPSLRLSSQGQAATQTAAYRQTDQSSLSRTLKGDLDWVVMKALEKDRKRRYDSASRLAEDLNNYLGGGAVEARPPTIGYRISKVWKRNRLLTTAVSAVVLVVFLGFIGLWWKNQETRQALVRYENAMSHVRDYGMLLAMTGDSDKLQIALQIARQTDSSDFAWHSILKGQSDNFSGNPQGAIEHFKIALAKEPDSIIAESLLAMAYANAADFDRYLTHSNNVAARSNAPLSQEEKVYVAFGMGQYPHSSFELIETVEDRNTPFANLVYADVLSRYPVAAKDPERIRRAVQKLQAARALSGENSFLSTVSLRINHTSLLSGALSNAEEEGLRLQATRDIEALRATPNFTLGKLAIAFYLSDFRVQESHAVWQEILNNQHASSGQSYAARALTLKENTATAYETAVEPLRASKDFMSRLWLAYCLFKSGRKDEAEEVYRELKQSEGIPIHSHLYYLSLVGSLERLAEESRQFLEDKENHTRTKLVRLQAQYYAEQDLDNEQTLRNAAGYGTSKWVTAVGTIARVHVLQHQAKPSRESRTRALKTIQEILDSHLYNYGDYHWAKSMKTIFKGESEQGVDQL
ncbi:MAG: protein kinase domain-containing protein [Aureliella sp.]